MNRDRREKLATASRHLSLALGIINDACEAEQQSFDNLPESIQDSDRGSQMEDNVSYMEDAASDVESALDNLSQIV